MDLLAQIMGKSNEDGEAQNYETDIRFNKRRPIKLGTKTKNPQERAASKDSSRDDSIQYEEPQNMAEMMKAQNERRAVMKGRI